MTAERNMERVLQRWLVDGIDEMPDRVFLSILDRVERQPQQRAWRVSWKDSPMNTNLKPLLAVAAVVVTAVAGIAILARPTGFSVGGPTAVPSPPPTLTPAPAVGDDLGPPGTILRAAAFSEPFTFTMPAFPSDPPTPVSGAVDVPGGAGQNRQFRLASDSLWGSVTFHDDQALPADMCRPSGPSIEDVPATPDAVGRWLGSGAGLEVSDSVPLTVDGGTALRWDVTGPHGVCDENGDVSRPAPWFGAGEHHRIYAVPTGSDTILVITWGTYWSNGSEEHIDAVNVATDDLVRSMRFDN